KPRGNGFPLYDVIEASEAIAKTALRHRHPLTGGGFYATKFAEAHADAVTSLQDLKNKCSDLNDNIVANSLEHIESELNSFFDSSTKSKSRGQAKQKILFQLK